MENERFNLFCQLTKVDEKTRRVYGRATQEVPDGVREIMDYETSKPNFEKWSSDAFQRTVSLGEDGTSYGNVREMHQAVASGKIVEPLTYNDAEKAIDVVTECVDDGTWDKIRKGVLSGFSIGGKYGARWQDPNNPRLRRYTAIPQEISYVDVPAVSTATFTLVKMDGSEEQVGFEKVATGDLEEGTIEHVVQTREDAVPITTPEQVQEPVDDPAITPVLVQQTEVPIRPEVDVEVIKAFTAAIVLLDNLKKTVDVDNEKQLTKLKAIGSDVGINRRENEPLKPSGSDRSDDYGDPANWAWEYRSLDQCQKALETFNAGKDLEKYLDRERHILGRRIANQLGKLTNVQYLYDPKTRQIGKGHAMQNLNKDGLGQLITQLAAAYGIAADQVAADPQGALSEIVNHLAGAMSGATTAPSSSPSGISTVSTSTTSVPSMSTPSEMDKVADKPTETSTTTKEAAVDVSTSSGMNKVESDVAALASQVSELTSLVKNLIESQKPAPKVTLPGVGLNTPTVPDNVTPLEKALANAGKQWEKGLTSEEVQPILEAANGDYELAQNKALEMAKRSLATRGFTSLLKIRTLDAGTLAAIRSQTPVRS